MWRDRFSRVRFLRARFSRFALGLRHYIADRVSGEKLLSSALPGSDRSVIARPIFRQRPGPSCRLRQGSRGSPTGPSPLATNKLGDAMAPTANEQLIQAYFRMVR